LIGGQPKNDAFKHYFNWDNSVNSISFDDPSIAAIVTKLDANPKMLT